MPCPTYSLTTENPFDSTCRCTVAQMSLSRLPGRAWSIASSKASRVTASSFPAWGVISPTGSVIAESP